MTWLWITAAVVAALLLLWLGLRIYIGRRAELPPLAPLTTRYPIVMIHGFCGFARLGGADYFRGIKPALERSGARIYTPRLPPLSGVAARAEALVDAVSEICAELEVDRVNLIAHSMGGLDGRYAIAKLGLSGRVASLVTVGTPHRGTPVADAGRSLGLGALAAIAGRLGFDLGAVTWMTADAAERFNREISDVDGVFYGCVVGRATRSLRGPIRRYIEGVAGDSDGLVPVSSQRWGQLVAEVEADHFQQIGWAAGFDAAGLYTDLVNALVERGL